MLKVFCYLMLQVTQVYLRQALNRGGPLGGSDLVLVRHTIFSPLGIGLGEVSFPQALIDRLGS